MCWAIVSPSSPLPLQGLPTHRGNLAGCIVSPGVFRNLLHQRRPEKPSLVRCPRVHQVHKDPAGDIKHSASCSWYDHIVHLSAFFNDRELEKHVYLKIQGRRSQTLKVERCLFLFRRCRAHSWRCTAQYIYARDPTSAAGLMYCSRKSQTGFLKTPQPICCV